MLYGVHPVNHLKYLKFHANHQHVFYLVDELMTEEDVRWNFQNEF